MPLEDNPYVKIKANNTTKNRVNKIKRLIIFHLVISCLVVQWLAIVFFELNELLINKIDTVKGKSKKAFENCLRFIPDCLRISSSLKFQAKEIRKNNEMKNKKITIKSIVINTFPIKESRSILLSLCELSLGLSL
ncbi:hypothetical protein [Mesomycoplasma ovipneumoniae]|uniref:hypothetical protein n=1 Tax=Mesomycoplasma ovipneumoniae TaxID=29562 RepID=UPI002DDAEA34|nr:hypothetical protein [Mesomycoplasma ovipneumoniae]